MTYTTSNAKSAYQPLRSIPLIRPVSCLGSAFLARHDPAGVARQMAERALHLARVALVDAADAYAAAKAEVGACNRMRRHDRAIYSDRTVARRLSAAFDTMNRRRGHVSRARKALAAAEAALLALAI